MQKSRGEKSISVHNGVKSPFDDVCMEMKLKELKSFAGFVFAVPPRQQFLMSNTFTAFRLSSMH